MVFDDGKPTKHERDSKKLTIRQQAKQERKLVEASTGQIVRHLMYRHRVGLLSGYSIGITLFGIYIKWLN